MGNLEPSGSHSLHPHCFHPHSVPQPATLKETGRKADLGKRKGKCKQGSQREAMVLSPSPSLGSFCCLCSCLLSCPSHDCPHHPSSRFLPPNASEFLNPGALRPGPVVPRAWVCRGDGVSACPHRLCSIWLALNKYLTTRFKSFLKQGYTFVNK